jgi:hypothetical protein
LFDVVAEGTKEKVMKQLRSSVMVTFSFGLLFLSLLMPAAMAQQEVAPERFDRSWGTAQPHKVVSHHKNTKQSEARRARRAVPATAKPDSQKAAQTRQAIGRSAGDETRL